MEEITDILAGTGVPPQEDHPDEPKKVLKLARYMPDSGASIQKLALNRWYVEENDALLDLADDLGLYPKIQAVGVVDGNNQVTGIIVRKDLFELLGRPFGRDVLKKENISRAAIPVKTFFHDSNVFSVCEEIGKLLDPTEIKHFPLRTGDGEFAGIFSSQDLLLYLADMSQKDLRLAESIQSRLSQEFFFHKQDNFQIVAASHISKGVGGDFSYVGIDKRGYWYIAVCDTSSRGLRASLASGAIWSVLQNFDRRRGLAALIARLNDVFYGTFESANNFTGLFGDFDPAKGQFIVCDQAHGHAYLIRSDKLLRMKSSTGAEAVGSSRTINPTVVRYNLEPGDYILFASDGFVKQGNRKGEEFGLARIKTLVRQLDGSDLETVGKTLQESFKNHQGQSPQRDDASFVLLRYGN